MEIIQQTIELGSGQMTQPAQPATIHINNQLLSLKRECAFVLVMHFAGESFR
jgi:hypothetical protein